MKFIIDAQLPRRLSQRLNKLGYDSLHTLDLPLKNRTPDKVIEKISAREKKVVVTKDADFVNSFTLHHRLYKLLLVSTGNISNVDLETLFLQNIEQISEAFEKFDFIEINQSVITFHE